MSKRTTRIILLVLLIVPVFLLVRNFSGGSEIVEKSIEKVSRLNFLESPVQTEASGETSVRIYGTNVKLTYVAEYTISGRVLITQSFSGGTKGRLSPVDVALAWDFLADTQVDSKITWGIPKSRFYSFAVSDGAWLNRVGGPNVIISNSANNHLIPADNKIRELIGLIEAGDYIRIEGYLVNVYWEAGFGSYYAWDTSTTRTDTGDGSCEIIYVTDIKWLEL